MTSSKSWSQAEDKYLKENYKNNTDIELAKELNRPSSAIKKRRKVLNLKKKADDSEKKMPIYFKDWFDEERNEINFEDVVYKRSNTQEIKLKCPLNKRHLFKRKVSTLHNSYYLNKKIVCDYCSGQKFFKEETFSLNFPKLVKSFSKDNEKKPNEISYNFTGIITFECKEGHKDNLALNKQTTKDGKKIPDYEYECSECNFVSVYDDKTLMEHVDLKKNKLDDLKKINHKDQNVKIWFSCSKFDTHISLRNPYDVLWALKKNKKYNCLFCLGKLLDKKTNTLSVYLKKSELNFDKIKNKDLDPTKIYYLSQSHKIYFKCNKGHEIHEKPSNLVKDDVLTCPTCIKYEKSLQYLFPEIYKEIHPTKNNRIEDLELIAHQSHLKIWWQCSNFPNDHEWPMVVSKRTGERKSSCPLCKKIGVKKGGFQWRKETVISFINSIQKHIDNLTPAEIYQIFQQTGKVKDNSMAKEFINDFIDGKFPKEEIKRFTKYEKSEIDKYFDSNEKENFTNQVNTEDVSIDGSGNQNTEEYPDKNKKLPEVSVTQTLDAMEYCIRNSDNEALDFLLASAKNKLWKKIFEYEDDKKRNKYANEIIKLKVKDKYSKIVIEDFVKEYNQSISLKIPKGYNFKINGKLQLPNLMQLRTASKIKKDRFVGNWSGTGAGKTLSAILASRVINSKLTLICCPNSVVDNWESEIMEIYPDSFVQKKSFDTNNLQKSNRHKYLILNYEAFQQKSSDDDVLQLLDNTKIDFVVIDEVHYTKQRNADLMSKRKRLISSLVTELRKRPNFSVLGMSATPVINNLEEGKGLIEMITGESHDDLDTKINEDNCMKLHQKLVNNGLRMVFRPDTHLNIETVDVDCTDYVDEFKALQNQWFPLNVEQITTKAKIKTIIKHIRPKTLIYTHYRQGIDQYLYEEIEKAGWRVGFFTGEDKSGLDEFRKGTLDVLIGTSTIGTGVNGLQNICSNLIVNSMPWTNAEFEQLIGRIYRQNQKQKKVNVIIPLTKAVVNGEDWSWCQSRYNRIKFKKTIGDAVIDGVLPTESIRTQAQVVQDIKKWLDRLSKGDETIIKRTKLKSQFIPGDKDNIKKRVGKFGDFSKMNTRWNKTHSEKLHERLQKDSTEFYHYHEMMEEKVKDWSVVPAKQIIKYYKNRPSRVIGDFGCGKAHLYNELSNKHQIYSFDHVAVNEHVTACDFSHTPLDPETLDSAVFSLSFMGSNITDYVKEAFRVMKVDGRIHIIEATSRFKNLDNFINTLEKMGFEMVQAKPMSDRFTHIMAIKSDRSYNEEVKLVF